MDCFEKDLRKQAKVAKAFIRVLGKVDVFFPSEEEEEGETGGEGDGEVEAMERQTKAVGDGIDKLHNLDSFIVGNDDWITDNFSSLFQTSPPSMKGEDEQAAEVVEVDEDLVDRDQIHPFSWTPVDGSVGSFSRSSILCITICKFLPPDLATSERFCLHLALRRRTEEARRWSRRHLERSKDFARSDWTACRSHITSKRGWRSCRPKEGKERSISQKHAFSMRIKSTQL